MSEGVTCGAGLFCNWESSGSVEGVCRRRAALGESCSTSIVEGNSGQGSDSITRCDSNAGNTCVSCK
ncbi:MAG TPA: hypothetical protein VFK05_35960 [Polyangiaceae bacterium]|nr:hypothetical protein [Polyangiaceae bacterium]